MGLLDGIQRAFNIGGAKISIHTEREVISQGGVLAGVVVVNAQNRPVDGKSLWINLEEFWTEYHGTGKTRHKVTVRENRNILMLAQNFVLEPNSEYSYPFEMQLPLNSRLSTRETGWALQVSIDVHHGIDPGQRMRLNVGLADDFLAIVQAFQWKMAFKEKEKSRRWKGDKNCTYFRILPDEQWEKEFDYIAFELTQLQNGGVTGKVIFNLQEKSFTDYIKAMFMQDRSVMPFKLTREQLFLPDGNVNQEEIVRSLKSVMDRIAKERDPYNKLS